MILQGLDQLVQGARRIELRVAVDVLGENADGLAVEGERHIRIAADTVRAQVVRVCCWNSALLESGVCTFSTRWCDDSDIAVECKLDRFSTHTQNIFLRPVFASLPCGCAPSQR